MGRCDLLAWRDEQEDAAEAFKREREICPQCDGDGDGPSWEIANCPKCGGSGKVERLNVETRQKT